MLKTMLVAVDGSEGSRHAARFATDLARQTDARVILLHVLEPLPVVNIGFPEAYGVTHRQKSPEEIEQIRGLLDELAHELDGQAEKVIEYGSAPQVICDQAKAREVDMVVIGARGLGPVGRLVVGSVSDRVVHGCSRPVLVVH